MVADKITSYFKDKTNREAEFYYYVDNNAGKWKYHAGKKVFAITDLEKFKSLYNDVKQWKKKQAKKAFAKRQQAKYYSQ